MLNITKTFLVKHVWIYLYPDYYTAIFLYLLEATVAKCFYFIIIMPYIYPSITDYMKLKLTLALLLICTMSAKAQTATPADKDQQAEERHKKADEALHKDWANIKRYEADNAKVITETNNGKGVVYMGDSITDAWINNDPSFFDGKFYYDRGISGQTTTQMLVRFRDDVINLKPAVVVILAGINDIAENNGPIKLEAVFGNIKSMTILAREAGIKVVLASVLPAFDFPWRPGMEPAQKVVSLNAMIKDYADKNHIVYLDYFSAMADERQGLPKSLSNDGVHPTLAGYKIMEPLAEKAIAEALKRK